MYELNPPPYQGLIGHRGVAGLRPENTYSSFKYAAELGLNWVEFDTQLTKDRKWVVLHDASVDRTTNGKGLLTDLTLADLDELDAGHWFSPEYANERIPTLEETLLLCQFYGLQANIEIKGSKDDPLMHAECMYEFLQQNYSDSDSLPLLSSFDLDCLIALRKYFPNFPISFIVKDFTPDAIKICQEHSFTTLNCGVYNFTLENLKLATDNNLPILLYTINDPVVAHQWLDAGVTAIFSDRPDLLLKR
jgi:glycerophosphoryl diester phosphodiesterase